MGNGMDMLKAQRDKRKPVGNEMPKPLHGPRASRSSSDGRGRHRGSGRYGGCRGGCRQTDPSGV